MAHKFDLANKENLLSKARQEMLDPQRVFSLLPLRPYQKIADVGCGPGFFTIPLAKYLFDGRVYAIDVEQQMLDALKERLASARLGNVEILHSTDDKKIPLEEGTPIDGALLAFSLHETADQGALLKDVFCHLQLGGWTAIIEWYKRETEGGPPVEERLTQEEVRGMGEESGFVFVKKSELNENHYMVLLRKSKRVEDC